MRIYEVLLLHGIRVYGVILLYVLLWIYDLPARGLRSNFCLGV
jgi:hypothetical protein